MNDFDRFVDGTILHIQVWNNSVSDIVDKIKMCLSSNENIDKVQYLLANEKFREFFKSRFNQELEVAA